VYGRTETTAEALAQLELELEGAVMLGEARRNESALSILFQSGRRKDQPSGANSTIALSPCFHLKAKYISISTTKSRF
jgi:hypothetical protein